jgi:hypothetical protein
MPSTSLCLASILLASLALVGACASGGGSDQPNTPRPNVSEQAYAGPAVEIDSTTGPRHLIVITAPSPGWKVSFDQVGPTEGDVFVTVSRPDPNLLYPAVMVEQKLDSTVPSDKPVRVFVRVVNFGAGAASEAYRLAKASSR